MSDRRDGLGRRLLPDGLYYVQDTRQVVGNCVLWWAKKDDDNFPNVVGAGYTCELNEAGVYSGTFCAGLSDVHLAWPKYHVDGLAILHVRREHLR